METVKWLLEQRRVWVALIPAAAIIANKFGVPMTEDILTSVADKLVVAVSSALSLWSLFKPKPAA